VFRAGKMSCEFTEIRPANSALPWNIPVSMTAMIDPSPVMPATHAVGAPWKRGPSELINSWSL